jgi:L-methionine (R)-S-oxide reductase
VSHRLTSAASEQERRARYREVRASVVALLEGEDDLISGLSSVVSELHNAFGWFQWTGFYRVIGDRLLAVGPYQGGHGCLRISFDEGVCGAAARTRETQRVPDVERFPGHIACSSTTRSEIVVPVLSHTAQLLAVLDVDSDLPDAFSEVDQHELEALCSVVGLAWSTQWATVSR